MAALPHRKMANSANVGQLGHMAKGGRLTPNESDCKAFTLDRGDRVLIVASWLTGVTLSTT